jgi:hypothetical protein
MAETVSTISGLPYHGRRRALVERDLDDARANNTFVINGTDPKFPDPFPAGKDVIVFLEYVGMAPAGTFNIKDVNGATVATAVAAPFDVTHSPLRMDGGVELIGAITIAKGFYLEKK